MIKFHPLGKKKNAALNWKLPYYFSDKGWEIQNQQQQQYSFWNTHTQSEKNTLMRATAARKKSLF